MHELIAKDPRNAERIFPYIGGQEVNDSPEHNPTVLSLTLLISLYAVRTKVPHGLVQASDNAPTGSDQA